MARKRALSSGAAAKEEPAATPSKPVNGSTNGSTPVKSTRSTRGSVAKVKAESPDAATLSHTSPIAKSKVKKEQDDDDDEFKPTIQTPSTPKRSTRSHKKAKIEKNESDDDDGKSIIEATPKSLNSATATTPSKSTLAKKLKQLEQYLQTPFPDYPYPTPEQCQQVQESLAKVHGLPKRPKKLLDIEGGAAGCGAVPDVLDALVRTILSQNTTSASRCIILPGRYEACIQSAPELMRYTDSTRAKNAMDAKYGRANYAAVYKAPTEDLAETIACGGLANVKAKVIKKVLQQLVTKQMEADPLLKEEKIENISLDYLHGMSDLDAMKELVSFDGVGPKTASCVLLFCL